MGHRGQHPRHLPRHRQWRHRRPKIFAAGLNGGKGSVYQGGTLSPCFFRWPKGGIPAGAECNALSAHLDLFPTLAEITGATLSAEVKQQVEGRSLLPLLKNPKAGWADRTLAHHRGRWENGKAAASKFETCAIQNSRFTLVNNSELYDLKDDPGETRNVIANHPEVVATLRAAYDQWWADVQPLLVNESAPPTSRNKRSIFFLAEARRRRAYRKTIYSVLFRVFRGDNNLKLGQEEAMKATGPTYCPEWTLRNAAGDIVKHTSGTPRPDPSNAAFREWWSDVIANEMKRGPIDGVFVDALPQALTPGLARAVGADKAKAVVAGLREMLALTKKKIGKDKILLANGTRATDFREILDWEGIDGVMIEHFASFKSDQPADIRADLDTISLAASKGKFVVIKGWPGFNWIDTDYL
jgi:hypothetical protein